jgi:hypothetical protein
MTSILHNKAFAATVASLGMALMLVIGSTMPSQSKTANAHPTAELATSSIRPHTHVVPPGEGGGEEKGHVHGICKNTTGPGAKQYDVLVDCAYFHVVTEKPPLTDKLFFRFKIKVNRTPQSFHLVAYAYKWPGQGAHAHVYRFCLDPAGQLEDCKRTIHLSDLPAPGHSEVISMESVCMTGRYYMEFDATGTSTTDEHDVVLWYDPHPSNKKNDVSPNRHESYEISEC